VVMTAVGERRSLSSRHKLRIRPVWDMRVATASAWCHLAPHVRRRAPRLIRLVISARAPRVPVPTGTHGEPRTTTVRISLTAHEKVPYSQTVTGRTFAPRYSGNASR
jgi:hypothetical protein